MVADKIEDLPTVYIVSETPDTLDKPVFDFSKISYIDGRDMNVLGVRIQQKNKRLAEAQNAESFEALVKQFESLSKEQKTYVAEHKHENKVIAARLKRIESRLENWTDPDVEVLLKELNALMDESMKHVLTGVTYVPQAWLVTGAPPASSIDWSDSKSLQYLRSDKFQALSIAKVAAQNDSPN